MVQILRSGFSALHFGAPKQLVRKGPNERIDAAQTNRGINIFAFDLNKILKTHECDLSHDSATLTPLPAYETLVCGGVIFRCVFTTTLYCTITSIVFGASKIITLASDEFSVNVGFPKISNEDSDEDSDEFSSMKIPMSLVQ